MYNTHNISIICGINIVVNSFY